jgi:hypothetical protein
MALQLIYELSALKDSKGDLSDELMDWDDERKF